ncbi:MAG TPA: hypothetical protein GXZ23_04640 [Clostridiales bacterium]|nr:hypothetical protein [Clostridiales bacterium]
MKHSWTRRIISLVIVVVLAAMPFTTAIAAKAPTYIQATGKASPVVVINGYQNNILYNYPMSGMKVSSRAQKVFPPDPNDLLTYAKIIVDYVLMGEGYYDEVTNSIFPQVSEMFINLVCNNDGTVRDNLGTKKLYYSLAHYKNDPALLKEMAGDIGLAVAEESGFNNVYVFSYDWRLSPVDLAYELHKFIEEYVKPQTGSDKVTIVSEGIGGNVAAAYLDIYQAPNKYVGLDNYVTINSTAQGMTMIGALYTGQIDVDPNGVVRWLNDWADYLPLAFASWLVNYIMNTEYELYHAVGCVDTYLIHELDTIYDLYIRNIIKNNAGLWACVPWTNGDYCYYEALEFIYPAEEAPINKILKSKLDTWHEIQRRAADRLQEAEREGVGMAVVSSYGMQFFPIVDGLDYQKSASETSDGIVDTKYSSFGATCAYLNTEWTGYQREYQQIDDGHNHLNTQYNRVSMFQGSVDASTCALPENTWFIYGLKNDYLHTANDDAYYFVNKLVLQGDDFDVWAEPVYPQYMYYNRFTDKLYVKDSNEINYVYVPGDTNLDGRVETIDAMWALRHSLGLVELTRARKINADVNGRNDDGIDGVSLNDARLILRYALGLEAELDFSSIEEAKSSNTGTNEGTFSHQVSDVLKALIAKIIQK